MGNGITVDCSFQSQSSAVGVDIPVKRSIQSYQSPVNFKSWHYCNLHNQLAPLRRFAYNQLPEFTTVAFRATKKMKTRCLQLTIWVNNCSFRCYLRKLKVICFPPNLWIGNRSFQLILWLQPLLLFLLWVTQSLLKTHGLKPFRTSRQIEVSFIVESFLIEKPCFFQQDLCKITGMAKLFYNALVNSPVIIRFLFKIFSCRFSLCYMMVLMS